MYKWEVVHKEEHPPSEGIVGTEVTEKMKIPEGTIYKNVILIGVGQPLLRASFAPFKASSIKDSSVNLFVFIFS